MEDNQSLLDLQVDQEISHNIIESTKWGKFMGLLVIIAFSLMFLLLILLFRPLAELVFKTEQVEGASTTSMMIFVMIIVGVVGVIMFILMGFLVRGANRVRKGIQNRDQYLFNSGLANVKNYFIMYGVLAILGLLGSLINLLNR